MTEQTCGCASARRSREIAGGFRWPWALEVLIRPKAKHKPVPLSHLGEGKGEGEGLASTAPSPPFSPRWGEARDPSVRLLLGGFSISLLRRQVDFAERHSVFSGDTGAIVVFRRENRRPAFKPAELALHRSPDSRHGARLPVQLVP